MKMNIFGVIFLVFLFNLEGAKSNPCADVDNILSFPVAGSCAKFVMCINGESFPLECAPGTLFDPRSGQCNLENCVDCRSVHEKNYAILQPIDISVHYCFSNEFSITPSNNCKDYIICKDRVGYKFQCPKGTIFDVSSSVCSTPESSTCGAPSIFVKMFNFYPDEWRNEGIPTVPTRTHNPNPTVSNPLPTVPGEQVPTVPTRRILFRFNKEETQDPGIPTVPNPLPTAPGIVIPTAPTRRMFNLDVEETNEPGIPTVSNPLPTVSNEGIPTVPAITSGPTQTTTRPQITTTQNPIVTTTTQNPGVTTTTQNPGVITTTQTSTLPTAPTPTVTTSSTPTLIPTITTPTLSPTISQSTPTTLIPTGSTGGQTVVTIPGQICHLEWAPVPPTCPPFGTHYFGVQNDCNAFQVCVYGRVWPQRCPTAQHWNPRLCACDWPTNANCPYR